MPAPVPYGWRSTVGRLEDGEETEWEVHETLRKIYIA